jgi:hypothetical protein
VPITIINTDSHMCINTRTQYWVRAGSWHQHGGPRRHRDYFVDFARKAAAAAATAQGIRAILWPCPTFQSSREPAPAAAAAAAGTQAPSQHGNESAPEDAATAAAAAAAQDAAPAAAVPAATTAQGDLAV